MSRPKIPVYVRVANRGGEGSASDAADILDAAGILVIILDKTTDESAGALAAMALVKLGCDADIVAKLRSGS